VPSTALVVDDSSATRLILGGILRNLGMTVTEAKDGEEALRVLETSGPVEVVLLDWRMQPMDGPTFLQRVRADERFARLKVVMITAENNADSVRQVAALGIAGYIIKPFDKTMVAGRMAALGLGDASALEPKVGAKAAADPPA
jgi:two-component system chemotaxis response regulator CheY